MNAHAYEIVILAFLLPGGSAFIPPPKPGVSNTPSVFRLPETQATAEAGIPVLNNVALLNRPDVDRAEVEKSGYMQFKAQGVDTWSQFSHENPKPAQAQAAATAAAASKPESNDSFLGAGVYPGASLICLLLVSGGVVVARKKAFERSSVSTRAASGALSIPKKNVVILGGTGYVGNKVAKLAVERGHRVTSLSRRGTPSGSSAVSGVTYLTGDATDPKVVDDALKGCDAVVHALGLLFDATTPFGGALNLIVSGSKSRPGPESTYDAITRQTAVNAISFLKRQQNGLRNPFAANPPVPFCFVSAAEAGWPEMGGGEFVEKNLAPAPLKRYLVAKREVEAELSGSTGVLRPVVLRPSLIWDWSKLDVLPIIPVFNLAALLGVPFVDRTIRVETLARAIVAGFEDDNVSGVKRIDAMESLSESLVDQ